MKIALQDNRRYLLRFDKDEDVIAGLAKFMADTGVKACAFNGIGACSSAELGFFNTHLKEYRKKPILDSLEILSFSGNGSMANGQPTIHAHAMFGGTDFAVIGGHVFKMIPSVTCEVFLIALDGEANRTLSEEFNLNLLN